MYERKYDLQEHITAIKSVNFKKGAYSNCVIFYTIVNQSQQLLTLDLNSAIDISITTCI